MTGSASGIGRALTERLARAGDRVVATDLAIDALRQQAQARGWPDTVQCRRLDVTEVSDWAATLDQLEQRWGGLDVLYNIAGYLQPGQLHEVAFEEVDRHFDVNVKGLAYGMRAAAARMVAQGHGHIINVGSMSSFVPVPGISLYAASKSAVRSLSLAAAAELRAHGVAVTVVCPDAVDTPFIRRHLDREEAALIFSGPLLAADDVAALLAGPVLRDRPLEVASPKWRKWLARAADLFPNLGPLATPTLRRRGLRRQRDLSE